MAIPNVMQTGRSGLVASKAAIATTGHNIANAGTEGYSRQRVDQKTGTPHPQPGDRRVIGTGTQIERIQRINDEYIEKQIRSSGRELANLEEKDLVLKQAEDIFNESNGEGLNRIMSRFFNEFRKLSNEPDSEAIRQAVREAANSVANDFRRIRNEVIEVGNHIDNRIEGHVREMNSVAENVRELNMRIHQAELAGGQPNDLLDKRDLALKKLAEYVEINMHKDNGGSFHVDVVGVGPFISGANVEKFAVERSPADEYGKRDSSLDIRSSGNAASKITHQLQGGKLGALVEARDRTVSTVLERMDDLAFNLAEAVNSIHKEGFTRTGGQGVNFFRELGTRDRAAEFLALSDEVKGNTSNIATAAQPDAPGDNRIALLISGLQHHRIMGEGKATVDDFYNAIVSDIGVVNQKNKNAMGQQKEIQLQLTKVREQISGVSLDEETANLMQFQHAYGASAKVIQVADEMLQTILDLRR